MRRIDDWVLAGVIGQGVVLVVICVAVEYVSPISHSRLFEARVPDDGGNVGALGLRPVAGGVVGRDRAPHSEHDVEPAADSVKCPLGQATHGVAALASESKRPGAHGSQPVRFVCPCVPVPHAVCACAAGIWHAAWMTSSTTDLQRN